MTLVDVVFCQELENPVILIHEKKITSLQAILPVLELVVRVSSIVLFLVSCIHKFWIGLRQFVFLFTLVSGRVLLPSPSLIKYPSVYGIEWVRIKDPC